MGGAASEDDAGGGDVVVGAFGDAAAGAGGAVFDDDGVADGFGTFEGVVVSFWENQAKSSREVTTRSARSSLTWPM